MSTNSAIEWTETTWNPTTGCSKVSSGCANCYAETMSARWANKPGSKYVGVTVRGKFNGKLRMHEDVLDAPLHWRKPRRIFVNSMSDLFHEGLYGQKPPWKVGQFNAAGFEFLLEVWHVMRKASQHTFQILTKRPEVMADLVWRVMGKLCIEEPLPNVHLGTSVENQTAADERIPHLLRCPAAVRFLSVEPLLGPVDLEWALSGTACDECADWGDVGGEPCPHHDNEAYETKNAALEAAEFALRPTGAGMPMTGEARVHWVIVGGESGPGARPCNVAWIRSIIEQCKAAGVSCFVKQTGTVLARQFGSQAAKGGRMEDWPEDIRCREFPDAN